MGSTPTRRSSQATAKGPYWARGFASRRIRASTIRRRSSSGVRVGERCGARERPLAQPFSFSPTPSSARATHLRTHRVLRPSACAISSAPSPPRRRRTASLRRSSSDTPTSSLERTRKHTRKGRRRHLQRNDVLRSGAYHVNQICRHLLIGILVRLEDDPDYWAQFLTEPQKQVLKV